MLHSIYRRSHIALLVVLLSFACSEKAGRSIGEPCAEDGSCVTGLCYTGVCLDPAADSDQDGLTNALEQQLGSNPEEADTDGDGKLDPDELGINFLAIDRDEDSKPDIIESAIWDQDNDCLADELDPQNTVPADLTSEENIRKICPGLGVCESQFEQLSIACDPESQNLVCVLSGVDGYEPVEISCDQIDNDCDGHTDEGLVGNFPDSLAPDFGINWQLRADAAMAAIQKDGVGFLMVYGGRSARFNFDPSVSLPQVDVLSDLWFINIETGAPTLISTEGAPGPLVGAKLRYSPQKNAVFLFGGTDQDGGANRALWAYDIAQDLWVKWPLDTPLSANNATLALLPNYGTLYEIGGEDDSGSSLLRVRVYALDPSLSTAQDFSVLQHPLIGGEAVYVAHENAILVGGASDESGPIEGFSVLELSALGAPTGHDAEALGSFTQPQGMSFVYHSASKKVYATGVEDDAEGIPTAFVASRSDSGQWTRFVNPMGRQGASGFWLQPSGAVFVGGLDSVGEYGSAMLLQELPSGDLVATDELSLDSFPVFGAFGATQNYLDEDDKKRRVLTFPGLIPGLFGSEPSNLYWEVELDSGIDAWKKREARVVVDSEEIDAALVFTSVAMRSEAQYVFTYGSVVDPQTMTQIFGIFRLDRETQTWSKLSLDEAGLPGPIDGARLEYDGDQNKFFLSGGIQIDLSSGSMVPQDAIWSWTPGDVSMVLEHQPELSPFRIPLGIHSSVMVAGERLLVLLTNKDASYGVESFNVDTSEKIEVQSAGAPVLAYIRPVSVVFGSQILGLFPGTTGSFAARYLMVARGTVFDYESNVTYDDGAPFNGAVSLVDHDAATAFVLGGFDLITSRSPRRALNVEMTCE